jgi:NitT/TauT family transport system substrate-binding protein
LGGGIDRRTFLRGLALAAGSAGIAPRPSFAAAAPEKLSLRLEWLPQAEFAGYIVAEELGYFRKRNLEVDIRPGGPDHPALVKVGQGGEDIGIGPASGVFVARAKGLPLKIIAQPLQDSIFRFVVKASNRILGLKQLRGRPIGLWLNGDETEFIAMAAKEGLTLGDFEVIAQDHRIDGFIHDRYVLSEVTTINELPLLRKAGYPLPELQVLSPSDYGVAMPSDCLFVSDRTLAARRPALVRFLDGAREGWQTAFSDKEATLRLLVARHPELDIGHQREQLEAMEDLVFGPDGTVPFGRMDPLTFERMQQTLVTSNLLPGPFFLPDVVDTSLLKEI